MTRIKGIQRKHVTTLMVLTAYLWRDADKGTNQVVPYLMQQTNACENVVYSALYRDCSYGYLDYGVSIRAAWITEEGYQQLKILRIQEALNC